MIKTANRLEQLSEYYFSSKLEQIRAMNENGEAVINLGIGNPDLPPSPETIEMLTSAALEPGNHGYQPYRGLTELRNAIALWYKNTYGVHLDGASEILPLIGSKEGIFHISMAFLDEGDTVLVPDPGYPAYAVISRMVNAKVQSYDLTEINHWRIDRDQFSNMDLSDIKILWVNFPHMPTGGDLYFEDIRFLVDLARENQFLIVNDNPYSLILNPEPKSILQLDDCRDVLLELNSMSKSHNMAGWRLGWVAGKQTYIDAILKIKSNIDSGMFKPLQLAAAKALENSSHWHNIQNQKYLARRKRVFQLLDLLECKYSTDQTGMFVWAGIPDQAADAESFSEHLLLESRVFITPGFIFGSNGRKHIRISLCSTLEVYDQAIQRIRRVKIS